jgi:hypothetical protein
MNVRKIVESYEQDSSSTPTPPPSRPGSLRPRPRPRPLSLHNTSLLVAGNQRSTRPQRPPSLKIVKEEGPAAVLRECTNELQIEPRLNRTRLSVLLTSDTSHTFGCPSIASSKPLRAPSALDSPNTSLARPPSPSAPPNGVPSRLALQRRANLRMLRQQRYSRDESALAASLKRPAEYERVFPPRPSSLYAVRRLELRVTDAKARIAEVRELLRDETTDQAKHQALLRTRWMAERWTAAAEAELSRASTLASNSVPLDATQPLARKTRRDANLAYFFAHSPTRTTVLSTQHTATGTPDHPRLISKRDVEPPQLRTWPLTTTLREPMKIRLKTFPSTPYDISSQPSRATPLSPPVSPQQQRRPDNLDPGSPVSEPSLHTNSPTSLKTPLDDCSFYAWPGFADIYVLPHPSDEELLAALSADLEEEPMPTYVAYLLDRLEAIGEGVSLPGLSRRGSATSSAFEFISRPSIEVYDYPVLPHSRLLLRRSMRFRPPQSGLRILSGLRPVREDPRPQTSPRSPMTQTYPRSSVLDKMRRSMTVLGRE